MPGSRGRRRARHPATGQRDAPARRPELDQEPQGQGTGVDARLEPRAGARRTPAVAAARLDELGRRREQLVVALPQALGQPDPARDRLVQVDRRLLGVRRADLGDEPEVARVDHQQHRRHGLDRAAGAEQRDVQVVAPPAVARARSAVSQ